MTPRKRRFLTARQQQFLDLYDALTERQKREVFRKLFIARNRALSQKLAEQKGGDS